MTGPLPASGIRDLPPPNDPPEITMSVVSEPPDPQSTTPTNSNTTKQQNLPPMPPKSFKDSLLKGHQAAVLATEPEFQNRFDYMRALTDGPWTILGHYLTVEPWKPQFDPLFHKIISIVAWIQIPQLSSEYYDRALIHAICMEIGHFVRLDQNTEEALRGRYARVVVEIDLSKPLQSQAFVDGKWYLISYENIPDICFECGLVGHALSACPNRASSC
ncbi:hypothetical protein Tsubulata_044548 [Turnera subulata]|uniref:CCHC-type domain-containing protein n=1 Tax=Turnera subulata TaxID=218843 RepID=A0A9Q0GK09_9ROSI|nr:hypothetical protein Tsubulata_044548 [Turnera subulata]